MSFKKRTLRTLAIALLAASVPMVALANHVFTDVPTNSFAHEPAHNGHEAGVTNGCTATTFCPNSSVTRGQAMAFIYRASGRVGYDVSAAPVTATGNVATVAVLPAGTVADKTQFVKADATASVTCSASCTLNITDGTNDSRAVTLSAPANEQVALTWATAIPSDVPAVATNVSLELTVASGTASVTGDITTLLVPFSEDGDNALD